MSDLTKAFTAAFDRESGSQDVFSDSHRELLDVLIEFAEELNEGETFTARLGTLPDTLTPTLEIKDNASGLGQTFFIGYGYEPFGGTPTLQLSTGADRKPVDDKEDGYAIQYPQDHDALLKAVGAEVAREVGDRVRQARSVAHLRGQRAPGM